MKVLILKIAIFFLNLIYNLLKLLPQQNKIVFMSRQSDKINMDFELLGKELEKKYKVVYLCKMLKKDIKSVILYGIHMFKQMYYLATSKVCILDTYMPTVSILKHKKTLTVVQIWHSIGTMKKFGLGITDKKEGSNKQTAEVMKQHKNYDVIFASSDAYKHYLAEGFGCSTEKILTYTLPRIDNLFDKQYQENIKNRILKEYPVLEQKINIVYCPTFRKEENGVEKAINDMAKNIDYSKYNLIIKLHPLSKVKVEVENAIIDKKFSTFEMLSIADKVISDYSCVIYEAGVKGIPLYFYNFDMNEYDDIRGFNIDYNELPGYTSSDPKEIVESLEKEYDYNYLKEFIRKYVTNQENCAVKMARKIEEYM